MFCLGPLPSCISWVCETHWIADAYLQAAYTDVCIKIDECITRFALPLVYMYVQPWVPIPKCVSSERSQLISMIQQFLIPTNQWLMQPCFSLPRKPPLKNFIDNVDKDICSTTPAFWIVIANDPKQHPHSYYTQPQADSTPLIVCSSVSTTPLLETPFPNPGYDTSTANACFSIILRYNAVIKLVKSTHSSQKGNTANNQLHG